MHITSSRSLLGISFFIALVLSAFLTPSHTNASTKNDIDVSFEKKNDYIELSFNSNLPLIELFSHNKSGIGKNFEITLNKEKSYNVDAIEVIWPTPQGSTKHIDGTAIPYSYYKLPVQIKIKVNKLNYSIYEYDAILELRYSFCANDICKIERRAITIEHRRNSDLITIIFICIGAFISGFLLNGMPCVLPVISIKISSLFKYSSYSKRVLILHIIAISCGVLMVFASIGIITIFLKYCGLSFGWGMHFQSPIFVTFLALVMMYFANQSLNKNSYIMIPPFINNIINKFSILKNEYFLSFSFGLSTTLLAIPCAGPFLAPAIAFSMSQGYIFIIAIHIIAGLGVASPYIVLLCFSRLIKFIPRSSIISEGIILFLILPIIVTYCWLLYILAQQMKYIPYSIAMSLILLLQISFTRKSIYKIARMVKIKYTQYREYEKYKILYYAFWVMLPTSRGWIHIMHSIMKGIMLALPFTYIMYHTFHDNITVSISRNSIEFQIQEKQKHYQLVLVNITADWCITCKVNKIALNKFMNNHNDIIGLIELDYTNQSDEISRYIMEHNSNGIPFTILYRKNGTKMILPTILTNEILSKILG
ncbi:protein-disulfide reductase DsbD family protein [Candidatus Fokinia crypta]|uniref:Thiol:disulfide interchange protein DsbD family protein n=1 Tax=Candidatus Fokinia crypta TaxID=1920990 RepID=A0ABZ0UPH0_9RICK|nr:thioredoxin domain-containing protein [Candidatus Fokinia cryptica]WPX98016.1 Thiol:disulfide interchange protein DsbD family protein [Candidatus Fokinia cryptica]